jgi:hypothetical protein
VKANSRFVTLHDSATPIQTFDKKPETPPKHGGVSGFVTALRQFA